MSTSIQLFFVFCWFYFLLDALKAPTQTLHAVYKQIQTQKLPGFYLKQQYKQISFFLPTVKAMVEYIF